MKWRGNWTSFSKPSCVRLEVDGSTMTAAAAIAKASIGQTPVQRFRLGLGGLAVGAVAIYLASISGEHALLFAVGLAMGVTLYHAAFGFTAAYRRAIIEREISGVTAQLLMLAAAMLLFAPILARGEIFGHGVVGAVAPVGFAMAVGAFVFGIGMQLASGCGSGTLFAVGGGNLRMIIVLAFFCIGGFWGSLDLAWWQTLPGIGGVSLGETYGWAVAVPAQLAVLAAIYLVLRKFGGVHRRPLWWNGEFSWRRVLRGPWPLLLAAGLLALLNWATLLIAGHPWSVTWAFALWAAKAAILLGWDPASSGFWNGGFAGRALARPLLNDITSVMNIGIILGASLAATMAGRLAEAGRNLALRPLLAAVVGGLMLGYGARLAYGCNIGAFFSGVASTSLHGWLWIVCAVVGNVLGVRLRPVFGLSRA